MATTSPAYIVTKTNGGDGNHVLVKIVFKDMVTTSPINNITKMETTKSRQPRSPAYIARMNERIGKPFFEIILVRVGKPRPRRKHTL